MSAYPEVVAKIASDYLERVKSQLRLVPAHEQVEFLREIESHLYESYQQMPAKTTWREYSPCCGSSANLPKWCPTGCPVRWCGAAPGATCRCT